MRSISVQLNGIDWVCTPMGEQVLLFKPKVQEHALHHIHAATHLMERAKPDGVTDIIPAYESMAIVYDHLIADMEEELKRLEGLAAPGNVPILEKKVHEVPVCYDMGLDWDEIVAHTGLSKSEIIHKHIEGSYTVAMMGFTPGFIYLDGLSNTISCPRKEDPRSRIPAGSVGIGGAQTGIYSLESPGGWQIIGKTPFSFFDAKYEPPTPLGLGDHLNFYAVSESEFLKLRGGGKPW